MSTPENLMAMGEHSFLAKRLGFISFSATIAGATAGAARQLPGQSQIAYVIASNSGSGLALPPVGGDTGCEVGDEIWVLNTLGAQIYVYANNNAAGSAVTVYTDLSSVPGTTGVSVSAGKTVCFKAVNISTWIGLRGSSV